MGAGFNMMIGPAQLRTDIEEYDPQTPVQDSSLAFVLYIILAACLLRDILPPFRPYPTAKELHKAQAVCLERGAYVSDYISRSSYRCSRLLM